MSSIQIFVILSGIVLTILIAWYFWFAPKTQTRAAVSESGAQEVAITVKGGYTPDVIVIQKGRPSGLSSIAKRVLLVPNGYCSQISIKAHCCRKANKLRWN